MARETDGGVRLRGKRRHTFTKQAVKCDMYDRRVFTEIKGESEKLQKQQEKFKERLPTFEEFHQDVFDVLFKYSPKKEQSDNMQPGWETNLTIIEKMTGENLYKELRSHTILDEAIAAIATEVITDKLSHFLPDKKKMPKNKPKKGDKDPGNQGARKIDQGKLKRALQEAMTEAKGECEDIEVATTCWGTAPGSPQKLPNKEKLALANRIRNNPTLWQLAKIAGRFRQLALSTQRTKVQKGNEEVYSIECGDDVARILPSELVKIAHPAMRKLLFYEITSGQMLQFALRSKQKEQKGPIVCAIDNSGSMSGDREIWAKAIALGLLQICVMQKRRFVGIHFGSANEISTHVFDWDKYTLENILDFAEHFFGGGTDFQKPLDVCAYEIGKNPRADIIMISDGECDVQDKWLADFNGWRDDNEVSVWSVLIDPYGHRSRSEDGHSMMKFSNGGVFFAKDLMDDSGKAASAVPIFSSV